VPHKGQKENFRASESYNKLSYNSAFPWQADGKNGEVSMNYMFHLKNDSIPHEPVHIYNFKKYEDGIYYREAISEYNKGTTIHLAEKTLENGILRVDKVSGQKATFSLGHYALPNVNGYIKESSKTIDGKKVKIIDNGNYKLAMIPLHGWNKIETITSTGLHPSAKESKTINVSAKYTGSKKKNTYITAMLWKKASESFTNEELSFGHTNF